MCGKEVLLNKLRRQHWQKCFSSSCGWLTYCLVKVCGFQACQFVAFVPGGKSLTKEAVNTMALSFIAPDTFCAFLITPSTSAESNGIKFNALRQNIEI